MWHRVRGIENPVTSQSLSSEVVLLLWTSKTRHVKERFGTKGKLVYFE